MKSDSFSREVATPAGMAQEIEAIFFDAGRTLLYAHPSVGDLYARAAARQGRAVDPATMEAAFVATWHRQEHEHIGEEFWRRTVYATMERVGGVPDPEACFQELWRVFAQPEVWRLYEDVEPALAELAARGYKLAVLSNWDRRLRRLIEDSPLRRHFHALIISEEVGAEKPDAKIFLSALAALGVEPQRALHVGDSYREDYLGARAQGINAILLDRPCEAMPRHPEPPARDGCFTIRSLRELTTLI